MHIIIQKIMFIIQVWDGEFTGGNQLSMLGDALYLNEGSEYGKTLLQSISYYYDFELGCNHIGKSFTIRLGHHFPSHFVSHNNWWSNIIIFIF